MSRKLLLIIALIVAVGGGSYYFATQNSAASISPQEAKQKASTFINENLLQNGEAVIKKVEKESSVYKLNVEVSQEGETRNLESYVSKDGKLFFTSAMKIEDSKKDSGNSDEQTASSLENITPQETPQIELFVMSHCPYGTQMEKALLPMLNLLEDKIDFDLRFCDYTMHGKKELDEQLRQTCIREEHQDKLTSYLDCFLESSDSEKCLSKVGLTDEQLQDCVSKTDEEFKVTEMYNNKDTWEDGKYPVFNVDKELNEKYDVGGSPALIINETKVQIERTPNALLEAVCAGFEEKPEECDKELSTQRPSSGFGSGTSNTAATDSCD